MLASDLNNPAFVGAVNPDDLLHVEFYWHEPIDKWKSEEESGKQQRKVVVKMERMPYIRIMTPGREDLIIETAVREDHRARFPRQWLAWQLQEGLIGDQAQIPGWPIDQWEELDP